MDAKALKHKQLKHFEKAWSRSTWDSTSGITYEKNLFHDYFRALPFAALKKLLDRNRVTLDGKKLLVNCCGTGIDVHYIRKQYRPTITVADLSENALEMTLASNPNCEGKVTDAEHLSFEDEEFDFSFIAASLHHLPRPMLGLYELLRVARVGTILIEPNDSWLARLFAKVGWATEYEEIGNYVYRLSKHDMDRLCKALHCTHDTLRMFATHKVVKSKVAFQLLKLVNGACNLTLPQWGNYIISFIRKDRDERPESDAHPGTDDCNNF